VTDNDNGGSFTYSASSTDGSDTGNVTLDRDQAGENTLDGNGLDNILVGRDGSNDTINAYQGNDVLIGGTGDDTLNGGDGRDWLIGGDGNDTLNGGAGNDLIEGGAGTKDVLDFSTVGGNWDLTLANGGAGTADVDGHDTYSGIEGIIGGSDDNKLTGNDADNYLQGNGGDDTLIGGLGNDSLVGNGGDDTYVFAPGDGKDTILDSGNNDTIKIDGTIDAFSASRSGNDLILEYGTASLTDQITVTNHFTGNTDVETLTIAGGTFAGTYNVPQSATGTGSNDVLVGTSGDDTLKGGGGDDLIFGHGGSDIIDFSDVGGPWSFTLGAGGDGTATISGTDIYSSIEGVAGGSGTNTITGNTGSNTLNGNGGDDTLDGGNDAVADTLNGGSGNDTLIWHGFVDTYDGGTGSGDKLDVSGAATVDFSGFADGGIENIETVRMTGGSGTTVTLKAADVVNFEGGTIDPSGDFNGNASKYSDQPVVRIEGDATDTVHLDGGGWFAATGAGGLPSGFALYSHVSSGSNPGINEDTYVLIQNGVNVTGV
jgi:Ca2+-binding RTX toxin-like protein